MSTLRHDFGHAIRSLRRAPGYAATAVTLLALSLGATALVWSAFDAVVLRPLPFPEPERLAVVLEAKDGYLMTMSPPNFVDLRRESASFESLAAWTASSFALSGVEGPAEQIPGAYVSADYFRVLRVDAALGRALGEVDDAPGETTVVIGHELWTRRFGADPGVVGRAITVDGARRTVVGVMPAGFAWPLESQVYASTAFTPETLTTQRGAHYLQAIGRLRAGASVAAADEELRTIAARLAAEYPRTNEGYSATARPLAAHVVRHARPTLLLLLGAVVLALVAACANLASVGLARAMARGRDLAVRASLGADPRRLMRELAMESLTIAAAGALVGCGVAAALVGSLPRWAGEMPRLADARLDLGGALVVAALAGICGLATGLLPALHALRRDPIDALRGGSRGVAGNRLADRARRGLVVTTTALAFLLLAGAALVVRSWNRIAATDSGMRTAGRLTFAIGIPDGKYSTPEQTSALVAGVVERLRTLPGVESAGAAFGMPFGDFSYSITLTARDGVPFDPDADDAPSAEIRVVTPGWLETMGVPLRRGRLFTAADRHGAAPVVVASETAVARLLGGGDGLGRTLELGTSLGQGRGRIGGEVVGVVADVRDQALEEAPRPIVYFVHDQAPVGFVSVVLAAAPERLATLVEPVRRAVGELDADMPVYRVRTMEQLIASATASRALVARLLSGFALVATVLAAVGLFGVLAAAVAERRRELAVRGALGATPRQLVRLVVNRGVTLVAFGLALGAVAGLPLRRVLESQLFELSAGDPGTLAAAALGLVGVALASCWAPARRAGRIDPMTVLRQE